MEVANSELAIPKLMQYQNSEVAVALCAQRYYWYQNFCSTKAIKDTTKQIRAMGEDPEIGSPTEIKVLKKELKYLKQQNKEMQKNLEKVAALIQGWQDDWEGQQLPEGCLKVNVGGGLEEIYVQNSAADTIIWCKLQGRLYKCKPGKRWRKAEEAEK